MNLTLVEKKSDLEKYAPKFERIFSDNESMKQCKKKSRKRQENQSFRSQEVC